MKNRQLLSPLLWIWGLEWAADGVLEFAKDWYSLSWVNPVLIGSAVLATLIIVLRGKEALSRKEDGNWLIGLLTVAMLIASVLFLSWTGVMDDFFVPLFSSLLLSVGLVMSGAWLNRSFVYIGLLLFLFTGISGYCYLGYTPIILPVAGGSCLIATGCMLRRS
ncbi:hypothetical protein B7C51_09125 [Paenibacillus larvae subsp. pulvifaciens]|uniref:Uncharacterized protein n=1 Tax=Paenibacillus larvae subsp. pulvifaciens TaxID=1477 RepID=A0A1V0URP3_9BACL|nr:hypothetical protein [Paenibacillus larvae]ARF67953.1 hypothetical protein B7C51_09125 [Paenibacillus larvae subsp. pulvifaciens]